MLVFEVINELTGDYKCIEYNAKSSIVSLAEFKELVKKAFGVTPIGTEMETTRRGKCKLSGYSVYAS